ncbi:hypothetical protein [Butyrivibrio sp. INlla14]|uniref:hypothetical protein n=1 Tax=Butyrivibrio sp. INlla14 TaxID=1520808 RepID=UPI0008766C19|nr:hypothetical protein [Butyrivibrio sp. INlla14]SCY68985.1 hypothetical protein SAMN02910371_03397 [Butyrivibrio sp. INlla14]
MKKKILSLIIATMLVASMLTACGNKNTDTTDSASKETTVVGSDGDGESAPEHVTGDAPASGDASESTNTPTTFEEKVVAASEHAIETFGSDGIPELDMEFTTEALNSYIEGEPSNRQAIANCFLNATMNDTTFVYNPKNYSSTLEMIEDAQANYKFGDNIFRSQDNRDEQIANAIDALVESLGTHVVVMVIDAYDSHPVMFYCDNGIGYGIHTANDEHIEFDTGSYASEGYDPSNNPHCYNVYTDGTVETQF